MSKSLFNFGRIVGAKQAISRLSELDEEVQQRWSAFSDGTLKDYNCRSAFDLVSVVAGPVSSDVMRQFEGNADVEARVMWHFHFILVPPIPLMSFDSHSFT